jgi:hypothetical protein
MSSEVSAVCNNLIIELILYVAVYKYTKYIKLYGDLNIDPSDHLVEKDEDNNMIIKYKQVLEN